MSYHLNMAKKRYFSPEVKERIMRELLSGAKTKEQLMSEHKIENYQIWKWKKEFVAKHGDYVSPQHQGRPAVASISGLDSRDIEIMKLKAQLFDMSNELKRLEQSSSGGRRFADKFEYPTKDGTKS